MTSGKVTLLQVARAAGVSRSTAARTLGGYGSVDPALRTRVLEAARAMGYRANSLARSVSSGRSHTIGVVVSDIENPHFSRAVRGIADVARASGFDVILVNTDEKLDLEREALTTLLDKRVDGLIVAPSTGTASDHLQDALDMNRSVVLLDRSLPNLDCDWIGVDDYDATTQIVNAVADAGHQNVCLIAATSQTPAAIASHTATPISPIAERIRALHETAEARGMQAQVLTGAMSRERTREVMRTALHQSPPPTAIIGSYSELVMTMLEELYSTGWRIPEELSVASLDDARWMALTSPPVTAARRPSYQLGARATEILVQRLAGEGPLEQQHLLPVQMAWRGSIGPAPQSQLARHRLATVQQPQTAVSQT